MSQPGLFSTLSMVGSEPETAKQIADYYRSQAEYPVEQEAVEELLAELVEMGHVESAVKPDGATVYFR